MQLPTIKDVYCRTTIISFVFAICFITLYEYIDIQLTIVRSNKNLKMRRILIFQKLFKKKLLTLPHTVFVNVHKHIMFWQ